MEVEVDWKDEGGPREMVLLPLSGCVHVWTRAQERSSLKIKWYRVPRDHMVQIMSSSSTTLACAFPNGLRERFSFSFNGVRLMLGKLKKSGRNVVSFTLNLVFKRQTQLYYELLRCSCFSAVHLLTLCEHSHLMFDCDYLLGLNSHCTWNNKCWPTSRANKGHFYVHIQRWL